MPTGLNFLLLGAARSGTSAVTEALNCFPAVFCAMEVIHAGENHKAIVFPPSIERRSALRPAGYHRDSLAGLLAFSEIEGDLWRWRQSLSGRAGEAFIDAVVGYGDPETIRFLVKMLYQPAIREMFGTEAARSARLRRTLVALPWTLKLRRLLLG